ncbi:MAG: hypothetical protein ACP5MD_05720, partial [Verrucomicrobiia bacterium]
MLPAFLATLLFSVSVIAASRSTRLLGANTANFGRTIVAVMLLGVWAFTLGLGFGGGAFRWFFLSGMIGFGVGDMALFHAFPRLGPRLCSLLINCLAAPFGAIVEWAWLGTGLSPAQVLCGMAILSGVGLALAPERHVQMPERYGKSRLIGICFGTLAGFGQGLGAVISRKAYAVASGWSVDAGTAAFQRILGGLLIVSVPVLWLQGRGLLKQWFDAQSTARASERKSDAEVRSEASANVNAVSSDARDERDERRRALFWVLLNGLAGPTVGVAFYQWALRTTPSGLVLAITSTTPLVVIPFAYWFEKDRPG